jgi:hypothetical protein
MCGRKTRIKMIKQRKFGQKMVAFFLAIAITFFQTSGVYAQNPTTLNSSNPSLPVISPNQATQQESQPPLPNPNAPLQGSGTLSPASAQNQNNTGSASSVTMQFSYVLPGDGNRDGIVNQDDYGFWKANFGQVGSHAADYNADGSVDAADYTVWRDGLGRRLDLTLPLIENPFPGDGNRDGIVNQADLEFWKSNFGKNGTNTTDYNRNGSVDAADYTVWRDNLGGTIVPLPGDGNKDSVVDAADYTIWRDNFGGAFGPSDYNGDGTIDAVDYMVWRSGYGKTLVNEYRKVVQANANALIDAIPPFEGPYGFIADPPDIPSKITIFNSIMTDWEPELLSIISQLQQWTTDPRYGQLNQNLRNQIGIYLAEMTSPGTGYIDQNNSAGFYGQQISYNNFLENFNDYLIIIGNAQTIMTLQIAPPIYYGPSGTGSANGSPTDPNNPTSVAKHYHGVGLNYLAQVCIVLCLGQGGGAGSLTAKTPETESEPWTDRTALAESTVSRIGPTDEQITEFFRNLKGRPDKDKSTDEPSIDQKTIRLITNVYYEFLEELGAMAARPDIAGEIKSFIDAYWAMRFTGQTILPDLNSQVTPHQKEVQVNVQETHSDTKARNTPTTPNPLVVIQKSTAEEKSNITKVPQQEAAASHTTAENPV